MDCPPFVSGLVSKLEQELAKLKQGDHICLIYESRTIEQMAVVVPFIMDEAGAGGESGVSTSRTTAPSKRSPRRSMLPA